MPRPLLWIFLSTPSARRATGTPTNLSLPFRYFYPRPPRGGRHPPICRTLLSRRYFYPRPPRGGRPMTKKTSKNAYKFLSTPSARRATPFRFRKCRCIRHFYPRPPRGGRLVKQRVNFLDRQFLSTPSARRATDKVLYPICISIISIHALREEGDESTGSRRH